MADAAAAPPAAAGGALMPRCDAFSSPIISDAMRRISSGVRAPAMNGSTAARAAVQSTPLNAGSKK